MRTGTTEAGSVRRNLRKSLTILLIWQHFGDWSHPVINLPTLWRIKVGRKRTLERRKISCSEHKLRLVDQWTI
jgi:hypothetical protein